MKLKGSSALLIFILASIVVFFVGFRFGKRIERLDKNYISPTPMVTTTPVPTELPITFDTFKHEGCALSFLHPREMTKKSASIEANLSRGEESISFSCEKKAIDAFVKAHPATREAKTVSTAGQNVKVFDEKKDKTFIAFNTQTGSRIVFSVSSSLADLVLKTLEFTK